MLISEFVSKLQKIKKEHGDIEIVFMDGFCNLELDALPKFDERDNICLVGMYAPEEDCSDDDEEE